MDGNSLTTGGKSLQFFPELDSDCSSSQNGIFHRRVWIFYVCKRTNEFLPSPWNKKRKKKEKETSPVPANQFGKRSFVFSFLFFFLSFLLSLEKNPLTPQKDFLIYLRKFTCEIISQFSWRRKIGARRTELSNAVAEIKISKGRREQRASIEKKKRKKKEKKERKRKMDEQAENLGSAGLQTSPGLWNKFFSNPILHIFGPIPPARTTLKFNLVNTWIKFYTTWTSVVSSSVLCCPIFIYTPLLRNWFINERARKLRFLGQIHRYLWIN